MRAGGRGPGVGVPPAGSGGRGDPGAPVAGRPAVHGLPVLRDATGELAPSKAGPRSGSRPGAEPDGGGELADRAPRAAHVESGGGARGVSVSPWGHGTYCARAGDLFGHHLHPGAGRIPVPGGDHGLVEPVRAVVGAGQHAGGRVLRGRAERGPGAARATGDLEHRPGQPVHERGLPWRAARGRYQDQHGRPGSVDRQPLHRTAVEVAGVRGGVPGGAGGGHRARRVIARWLDHYNHRRPHMAFNGRTPAQVYYGDAESPAGRMAA